MTGLLSNFAVNPWCPRDFQESSPAQFKGTNSLAFCLLYGPALTTILDHWEDHSLDYVVMTSLTVTGMDLLTTLTASKCPAMTVANVTNTWTARRSNQSILKEISPGCSLEGMMLKLKLQYFGHLMRRVDSLEKTLMLGGIGGRRRR